MSSPTRFSARVLRRRRLRRTAMAFVLTLQMVAGLVPSSAAATDPSSENCWTSPPSGSQGSHVTTSAAADEDRLPLEVSISAAPEPDRPPAIPCGPAGATCSPFGACLTAAWLTEPPATGFDGPRVSVLMPASPRALLDSFATPHTPPPRV